MKIQAKVNVHQAKTQLSKLLRRVALGEEVVIAKAGKPVAKLVPWVETRQPRKFGENRGAVLYIAPDFDAEDPEINALFYDGPIEPQPDPTLNEPPDR